MHMSAKEKPHKSGKTIKRLAALKKEGFGFAFLTKCLHGNLLVVAISLFIRPIHFTSKISLLHLQLMEKK